LVRPNNGELRRLHFELDLNRLLVEDFDNDPFWIGPKSIGAKAMNQIPCLVLI